MADGQAEVAGQAPIMFRPHRQGPAEYVPPAPVEVSGRRYRHRVILWSFVVLVLTPVGLTALYLWGRAADQYASRLAFSVRAEEQSAPVELLGGLTELSTSSSSDTDILFAYLHSQELVAEVDKKVDLRRIWSVVSHRQDPVFAYDPDGTIEDLLAQWQRKVTVIHDGSTGLIDLQVLAFDPQDARNITTALLEQSSQMINDLSRAAQEDALRYADRELEEAAAQLKAARLALTRFRNQAQIVDPGMDTQNQMGVLITLQQQLADALIEHDVLLDTTRANDPRITQASRRIEVINQRIQSEKRKLGLGEDGAGGRAIADLVGEYEGLIVDREFAETAYTAALHARHTAVAAMRKQSRYLAAHVAPTLAERPEYPQRSLILSLVALGAFLVWSLCCLLFYSFRDRR